MSSIPTPSSSFQPIFSAALSEYAKQTGIDLATCPFAQTLQNCRSADNILDLLQDKAEQFHAYRNGNRKLISCLKPVVQVLHSFSGFLAEAASLVSPCANPIFPIPLLNALTSRRHSRLQVQFWSALMFSLPYVFPRSLLDYAFVISRCFRRLSESVQVMTLSSTCSNALGTSSIVFVFIPRSLSPLRCPR
jgi:hypothetical protein